MDQNNRLEAKISKEETRTTLTMDLREVFSQLIKFSLPDQTSAMETINRIMEYHMINVHINRSIETMQTDIETDFSAIKMETGETMEIFPFFHQLEEETSHKKIPTANQEMINLAILPSTYLTIDLRLVLCLANKNFHKTITRRHLILFVSPQATIPIVNYQTSVR